jgi:DNA repair protein RadC
MPNAARHLAAPHLLQNAWRRFLASTHSAWETAGKGDMMNIRAQLQMYGAAGLSTLDLLALTLTQSTDQQMLTRLACLLQQYDVRRLRRATIPEFESAGLTRSQAERLIAICELTRQLALLEAEPRPQIKTPGDAVAILRPLMEDLNQEAFRILVLNTKNQVVENLELYRGTVNCSVVRAAEVLRPAVIRHCPAILVAHVHPSGSPEASPEDITMTGQLVQAGKLLDIELVDHLILGHTRYLSLRTEMRW